MYDDYLPILESLKKKLLKISQYESENIIATVLKDIFQSRQYGQLSYKFNYPLKYVIKPSCCENEADKKFADNIHTHCDFLIFNKLDKSVELVIEVDGSQHAETLQKERDERKDRLLHNAGIRVLRLKTTDINCEEKIIEMCFDKFLAMLYIRITIESVRGTSLLTTQQPTIWQGANAWRDGII